MPGAVEIGQAALREWHNRLCLIGIRALIPAAVDSRGDIVVGLPSLYSTVDVAGSEGPIRSKFLVGSA